jgi:hypothetical protein
MSMRGRKCTPETENPGHSEWTADSDLGDSEHHLVPTVTSQKTALSREEPISSRAFVDGNISAVTVPESD